MGGRPLGPEAPHDVGGREGGEGAEGGEAQADQHVGQVGAAEDPDRLGGEEGGGGPGRHHDSAVEARAGRPGGQVGGEPAVGDPEATARPVGADGGVEGLVEHGGGTGQHGGLAAQQPQRPPHPEGAGAGPGHLDPRGDGLEGGDDRLEAPGLERRIAVEDGHLRAVPLGLAAALPADRTGRPGGLGGGPDPAGSQHQRRLPGRHAEGGEGPVGAANDQRAGGGVHGRAGNPRVSGSSRVARRSRALRPRPVATTSARRRRRRP